MAGMTRTIDYKCCTKCGENKKLDEFPKQKGDPMDDDLIARNVMLSIAVAITPRTEINIASINETMPIEITIQ
jgi:hypothetical protein